MLDRDKINFKYENLFSHFDTTQEKDGIPFREDLLLNKKTKSGGQIVRWAVVVNDRSKITQTLVETSNKVKFFRIKFFLTKDRPERCKPNSNFFPRVPIS